MTTAHLSWAFVGVIVLFLVFAATRGIQGIRYHQRVQSQTVLFNEPVQVRLRRGGHWGKPFPFTHPSTFKLIVRDGSIETNRQRILLPEWADFVVLLDLERDPVSFDVSAPGAVGSNAMVLLTRAPRKWWSRRKTLALDVGGQQDAAVAALERVGVSRSTLD